LCSSAYPLDLIIVDATAIKPGHKHLKMESKLRSGWDKGFRLKYCNFTHWIMVLNHSYAALYGRSF